MTGKPTCSYVQPTRIGGAFDVLRSTRYPDRGPPAFGTESAQAPPREPRPGAPKLTRRQLLAYSAGTVVAAATAPRLPASQGRITFELKPGRATVLLDGKPAWVIDVSSFHGEPRLSYTRSVSHVRLVLASARFPGSNMPAGFVADCWRRRGRWQLKLSAALAGEFPTVDLAEWLAGRASLCTLVRAPEQYRLQGRGRVSIPGATTLEWRPDWLHSWHAKDLLEIAHSGLRARGRRLVAGLARPGSNTAISSNWLKRAVWHLPTSHIASCNRSRTLPIGDRRLEIATSARAVVSLETGITAAGRSSAFTLESESGTTFATALLQGRIDPRGQIDRVAHSRGIPLQRMRLVRTRLEDTTETHAEAAANDTWLDIDEASFRVTNSSQDTDFVVHSGTNLTTLSACHGTVRQIVLNVPGFDSALLRARDVQGDTTNANLDTLADARKPCVLRLDDFTLHVERMADQLHLDFEFQNMALTRGHGTWLFEPIDPLQPSLLRVLFPPQHLQERAYFYQEITEQVPLNANDPKWSKCPPFPPPPPNCQDGPGAIEVWKHLLNPKYPTTAANKGEDEFLRGSATERDTYLTKTRLAGASRLVFAFPPQSDSNPKQNVLPAPPTAHLLLNWGAYQPYLSPRALGPDPSDPEYTSAVLASLDVPSENESAIEFPTDLFLSADSQGRWHHPVEAPGAQGKPHDLWHTELSGSGVRALWATDFKSGYFPTVQTVGSQNHLSLPPHNSDPKTRMPMDQRDRHEIVALSSVFGLEALAGTANVVQKSTALPARRSKPLGSNETSVAVFMPQPVTVEHLSLSTLGATARLKGKWDPPSDDNGSKSWDALTVEEWRHIATLGRDVYVRMVYKGYLLPIGIRACLVKVTERQFVRDTHDPINGGSDGSQRMKAVLRQRMFIVIGKPDKAFPALSQPDTGRDWPFDQVEFTTLVTPDIIDPFEAVNIVLDQRLAQAAPNGGAFWPRVAADEMVYFQYNLIKDGTPTSVVSALVFVDNTTVHNPDSLAKVLDYYDNCLPTTPASGAHATSAARNVLVGGSRLAYAPSRKPGDTQFETSQFEMRVRRPGTSDGSNTDLQFTAALEAASQPPFYPSIDSAHIRVESIRRLSAQPVDEVQVRFDRHYLRDGFSPSANPGELYLLLLENNIRLNVAGNTSAAGGVATPNTLVVGLSRKIGLVGGNAVAPAATAAQCTLGNNAHASRARLTGASTALEDPNPALDTIRQGGFDPEAYFGAVLGDAKLLGLIRLVDLIKAASSVVNVDSAPQLLEQYSYALSKDVINSLKTSLTSTTTDPPGLLIQLRDALQTLNARVNNLPAVSRLLQELNVIITDTNNLAAPANLADPTFIAACTTLVLDAKTFLSDINNLASNPAALLPSDLLGFLTVLDKILQAVQADDLNRLVGIINGIDASKEPYQTINKALAPVSAPFQAAYVRARAIRAQLQQQITAGVSQLLDAIYPLLAQFFATYCELVDEGQCFAQAASAVKAGLNVDTLKTALSGLSIVPATTLDALDTAVSQIDLSVRTQLSPDAVQQNYAPALQSIANQLYSGAEGLRGRLVALRDQLPTIAANVDASGAIAALSAQSQLVTTVRSLEALIVIADGAIPNAPAPGAAPPRDLKTDLQTLSGSLKTVAMGCSDAATLIGHSPVLGQALDGLYTQLTTLFSSSHLDLIKARIDAAHTAVKQAADAIKTAGAGVASDLIQTYLAAREDFVWAAGLLATAQNCFNLGDCGPFDVFTDLQAKLQAALQDIGDRVVGVLNQLVTALQADSSFLGPNLQKSLTDLSNAITAYNGASGYWKDRANAFQQVLNSARSVVDTVHTAIEQGSVASLINVSALADQALSSPPLPTHLALTYDWTTPLGSYPEDSPTFEPVPDPNTGSTDGTLTLNARLEIDLLSGAQPTASIKGSISPFVVYLLNKDPDLDFFSIEVQTLAFTSSPGKGTQYTVKLGAVTLGQAFGFVNALESLFSSVSGDDDDDGGDDSDGQSGGNGFYSQITLLPPAIEVGYRFGFDILPLGEFAIENLRLALGFRLPFDNTPARLTFQVSTQEQPCLIIATPYGGGFFFGMVARAGGGVESLEGAFEFGAMTAFKFGPLSGSGRVAAGFYFSTGPNGGTICGYVVASGEASIAWFALSVLLRVSVCSTGANVEGKADFVFTFRVSSFFKLSFKFTAAYRFAGSGGSPSANARDTLGQREFAVLNMAQREMAPAALLPIHPVSEHLAPAGNHSGACTYSAPTCAPPRCPSNVTRQVLNERFRQRKKYAAA